MSSSKYCGSDQNFVTETCHIYRNISMCNYLYGKLSEEMEFISENQKFLFTRFTVNARPSF